MTATAARILLAQYQDNPAAGAPPIALSRPGTDPAEPAGGGVPVCDEPPRSIPICATPSAPATQAHRRALHERRGTGMPFPARCSSATCLLATGEGAGRPLDNLSPPASLLVRYDLGAARDRMSGPRSPAGRPTWLARNPAGPRPPRSSALASETPLTAAVAAAAVFPTPDRQGRGAAADGIEAREGSYGGDDGEILKAPADRHADQRQCRRRARLRRPRPDRSGPVLRTTRWKPISAR